jgi:DNA-binding CsgD family transcriptional regulator
MTVRGGRLMNSDRILEGKDIYIAGSRNLENEALARFLTKATGACCEAVSFEQMDALSRQVQSPQTRLFLFDALDRRIQAMIADRKPGTNGNGDLLSGLFSGLFQDGTNGGVPHRETPGYACGFFYRCDSADEFLLAIQNLFVDGGFVPEGPPVRFMRRGNAHDHSDRHPLSPREFHILFMMAGGLNNKDIAARLNISSHTVRTHLYNIFRKIKARNRVQASLWVHDHVERFFFVV